jgi:phage terminase large subunit
VKKYFVDFVSPTFKKPYKLKKDEVGRTRAYIPATVYDNPYLLKNDPGYIKRLESLPELEKQALLLGNWDIKREGLVYDNFSKELVKELQIELYWHIFAGLDFGATNPTACVFIATNGEIFYVFDEIYTPNITLDALAEEIKKRKARIVYHDPSGKGFARELKIRGINCQPADNEVLSGIFHVRQLIEDKKLFVSPKCENLLREIDLYSWDEGKDKPVKAFDHAMDALRYALVTWDKSRPVAPKVKPIGVKRLTTQMLRRF